MDYTHYDTRRDLLTCLNELPLVCFVSSGVSSLSNGSSLLLVGCNLTPDSINLELMIFSELHIFGPYNIAVETTIIIDWRETPNIYIYIYKKRIFLYKNFLKKKKKTCTARVCSYNNRSRTLTASCRAGRLYIRCNLYESNTSCIVRGRKCVLGTIVAKIVCTLFRG